MPLCDRRGDQAIDHEQIAGILGAVPVEQEPDPVSACNVSAWWPTGG